MGPGRFKLEVVAGGGFESSSDRPGHGLATAFDQDRQHSEHDGGARRTRGMELAKLAPGTSATVRIVLDEWLRC
jgi:hypothetical protein